MHFPAYSRHSEYKLEMATFPSLQQSSAPWRGLQRWASWYSEALLVGGCDKVWKLAFYHILCN